MPIYHLVIECCLKLMHLRSSILLLVIIMDSLQVSTTIYALLVSCPLYSFVILCLEEQRYMESLFWWVSLSMPQDSCLITFNVRQYSCQVMPHFPLVLVARVCFPCVSHALILLPLFSKNFSYTPSSPSYVVFKV